MTSRLKPVMVRGVWPLGTSRGWVRLRALSNCEPPPLLGPLPVTPGQRPYVRWQPGASLPRLPHLAMLHSGSMRCTRGSSMYSNCRLLSTRALSTLTETGTGPSPLDDGGETHTISFIDRLTGRQREGGEERPGQRGELSGLGGDFPRSEGVDGPEVLCSFLLYTTEQIPYWVYVYRSLFLLEIHLWLESGGNKLQKGIRECGAGAGLHRIWGIFSFLDFSRTG